MTTNPFKTLLAGLSSTEAVPVTLSYLTEVSRIINEPSQVVQTYGEAFQVLEFLAQAQVVELTPVENNPGAYLIRKL